MMSDVKFKRLLRYDPTARLFRVARFLWGRRHDPKGAIADPGHCNRLSLGVWPKLLRATRECDGWDITVLGLRLHYRRGTGLV